MIVDNNVLQAVNFKIVKTAEKKNNTITVVG